MLEITVKNDDFPKDYEFDIRGLGLFKNGESREVTAEQEAAFVSITGNTIRDSIAGSSTISAKGRAAAKDTEGGES